MDPPQIVIPEDPGLAHPFCMSSTPERFRQVHLDFHTSPYIEGIGAAFDPDRFADTLATASVNSITLFAKCHHGLLYYETDHEARHPHLSCDLLGLQIAALRKRDIKCPIYLSVQCDEWAADHHPEWIALDPEGRRVGRPPLSGGESSWQILDMASPYLDYLCAQTEEVLQRFAPVDGLFFDMCWDQPSVSNWAKARMREWNLDPASAEDRAGYARRLTRHYMDRLKALADRYQPGVPIWFNSRPLTAVREEQSYLRHVEIEALPTSFWGYTYFPIHVRLVRPLGLPMIGMTGRFHKGWADFGGLRTAPSLLYDCAQALAHGAGCSVGDQLHPSGLLDEGAYTVIGEVFSHVKKCEPWCRDTKAVAEMAVLFTDPSTDTRAGTTHEGAWRILAPLGVQFAFLPPEEDFSGYAAVYVPECVKVDAALEQRLAEFEKRGGRVIQETPPGEPSPFTKTYCRFEEGRGQGLPKTDHVFYEQGMRLVPAETDIVLARVVEPYFERTWDHFCSHAQTPPKREVSPYAAAVIRGNRALLAWPVLRACATHGNLVCRELVAAALEELLPDRALRITGPRYVEAVVNERADDTVVHLLSFLPQKRTPTLEMVEETIPAYDVSISLRVPRKVRAVHLQPVNQPLEFSQENGRCHFTIARFDGHTMAVVEFAD
jgi:hypothetical protein